MLFLSWNYEVEDALEKKLPGDRLAGVGDYQSLDAKLAEALLRIITGELRRNISVIIK